MTERETRHDGPSTKDTSEGESHETPLTPREFELLRLTVQGLTNQQIARRLGLTSAIVRGHLAQVLLKLEPPPSDASEEQPTPEEKLLHAIFGGRAKATRFRLFQPSLSRSTDSTPKLTPRYLELQVLPYLKALEVIQEALADATRTTRPATVRILSITQESPVGVSLQGAAQALAVVQETIVPWRRLHAKNMARLAEQERLAEIEAKRAEVLERRARAMRDREETKKLLAEARRQEQEARRLAIANESLRLELERSRIQLVLDLLTRTAPDLPEEKRIAVVTRLLPPITALADGDLDIVVDQ